MSNSSNLSNSTKTNYIVVIKDVVNDVLIKSFITNTTLPQLWHDLEVYYGSLNVRSHKSGNLEDPVLLSPKDYRAIVLGEVKDTGVIKVYDVDLSRGVYDFLASFDSSYWSKSREQRTE